MGAIFLIKGRQYKKSLEAVHPIPSCIVRKGGCTRREFAGAAQLSQVSVNSCADLVDIALSPLYKYVAKGSTIILQFF